MCRSNVQRNCCPNRVSGLAGAVHIVMGQPEAFPKRYGKEYQTGQEIQSTGAPVGHIYSVANIGNHWNL